MLFWPGLRSIHSKKRLWDRKNPDELWQRIYWAFHQSVCRIDVARRRDRLVQRIYNATIHRLHDDYRRDWLHAEREVATDPEELTALAGVAEGIDFEGMDLREACQKEIDRLRGHLDAGRITEADFLLLIGTRLYGQSISEYARGAGLNYRGGQETAPACGGGYPPPREGDAVMSAACPRQAPSTPLCPSGTDGTTDHRKRGNLMITKAEVRELITDLFEEEALVIGGLVAVHKMDDDLVWRLVKNLDVIRGKILRRLEDKELPDDAPAAAPAPT